LVLVKVLGSERHRVSTCGRLALFQMLNKLLDELVGLSLLFVLVFAGVYKLELLLELTENTREGFYVELVNALTDLRKLQSEGVIELVNLPL
jgi:hypothetical protein